MATEEIISISLYLLVLSAYFTASFFASGWILKKLERLTYKAKIPLRAGLLSFFFAPTVFACGAAAFVPFPILLVSEVISEPDACPGQIGFAAPTIIIFWFVCMFVYLLKLAIEKRLS